MAGVAEKILAVAMVCALAFAVLASQAAERVTWDIDGGVKELVHRNQHPAVLAGMHAVSVLGTPAGLVPLIALVSGLAWRRKREHAIVVPLVMIGAGGVQYVAKWAVDRPRPDLTSWGFPSGHVLSLVVLLGLACYFVAASGSRHPWRNLGTAGAAAVVLTVAGSRLYLNVHWLSDVVGGFAVGLCYLLIVLAVLEAVALRMIPATESVGAPTEISAEGGA